jgi:hypothetical protein
MDDKRERKTARNIQAWKGRGQSARKSKPKKKRKKGR